MIRVRGVTLRVQRLGPDKVLEVFSPRGRLFVRAEGAAAMSRWSGKTEPLLLLDMWIQPARGTVHRLVRADFRASYWALARDAAGRRLLSGLMEVLREPPAEYPLPQTYRALRLPLAQGSLTPAKLQLFRRCLEEERDRGSISGELLRALEGGEGP